MMWKSVFLQFDEPLRIFLKTFSINKNILEMFY